MRYGIGNELRGHFYFDAPNDEVAWTQGIEIFTAQFPRDRFVYLFEIRQVRDGYSGGNPELLTKIEAQNAAKNVARALQIPT